MSIIIGGAVGAAVGSAVIGAGVNLAVGAITSDGSSGGGGGGGGSAASAADPFGSQRGRYQEALFGEMQNRATLGHTPGTVTDLRNIQDPAATGMISPTFSTQTTGGKLMEQMLTPGYNFNTSDPSYKWRLEQGAGALASSNAARGLLNSGAAAIELQNYGQQAASQEFGAQFARAGVQDTSQQRLQSTQYGQTMDLNRFNVDNHQATFNNARNLNLDAEAAYQLQYGRLSQLSGATTGSPAVAGQLQQQETAAAAAGTRQILDRFGNAIGGAFSSGGGSANSPGGFNSSGFGSGAGYGNQDLGMYL